MPKPIKPRTEGEELLILRILNLRMDLTADDLKRYRNLEKGFEGEIMFDVLTEELQCEVLILNHLLLEVNHSYFEIDTLLIFQQTIYLCDVKNFEGDYIYKPDGSIQRISGGDMQNVLHQLQRCESLLRQFLKKLGYQSPIESHIVFINPEFTLYLAHQNLPIILPTQVNQFMKKLNLIPSKLNKRHYDLADQIIAAHHTKYPLTRLPPYKYGHLKKGCSCVTCHSFSISMDKNKLFCNDCGCEEDIDVAVLRSVSELKLLLPDIKITTNLVHEWCQVIESKKTIRRILKTHFKAICTKRNCYYE